MCSLNAKETGLDATNKKKTKEIFLPDVKIDASVASNGVVELPSLECKLRNLYRDSGYCATYRETVAAYPNGNPAFRTTVIQTNKNKVNLNGRLLNTCFFTQLTLTLPRAVCDLPYIVAKSLPVGPAVDTTALFCV